MPTYDSISRRPIIMPASNFPTKSGREPRYIPEIDGLRALSVVAVMLFHLKYRQTPGGFVGVDSFFVISGYLISKIIFDEIDAGNFSFAKFYERRIKRIFPAFFVVALATQLIFALWLSPQEYSRFQFSAIAAAFSFSNIFFFRTVNYFSNNLDIPLLHTWSLSVEEQFYLVFPAFVFLCIRLWPKRRVRTLLAAAGLSFVLCVTLTITQRQGAYYLPFTRWWELLFGSILACVDTDAWNGRIKSILSWSGLLGLIGSVLLFSERLAFPGWIALMPTLAASAIIAGASGSSLPNRLLKTSLMRWLGKISYSLYLVHWPLICLASGFFIIGTPQSIVLLSTLSTLLAWISWRFVESPFRRLSSRSSIPWIAGFFLAAIVICVNGLSLQYAIGRFWKNYPNAERYQSVLNYDSDKEFRLGTCFLSSGVDDFSSYRKDQCLQIEPRAKNVLLLGDSQSAQYISALTAQFPEINFLQASSSGCTPILNPAGSPRCEHLVNFIYREWLPENGRRIDGVILSARWSSGDIPGLRKAVDYISSQGSVPLVFGPSPEFNMPLPRLLAYSDVLNSNGIHLKKPLPILFRKGDRRSLDKAFKADPTISKHYVSIQDALCDVESMDCSFIEDGQPMFFDRNHFTLTGSTYVIQKLSGDIRATLLESTTPRQGI